MSRTEIAISSNPATMRECGCLPPVIARLAVAAVNSFYWRSHTVRSVKSLYLGCGWGDSTERRLNTDIANQDYRWQ